MRVALIFLTGMATLACAAQTPAPRPPGLAPAQSSPALGPVQAPPQELPDAVQPLAGTLFFSREQRDRLDKARKRGEIIDDTGSIAPEVPPVINGVLRRSDGKTTVWVDGKVFVDRTPVLVQRVQPGDVGREAKNNIKILGALDPPTATKKIKMTRKAAPAKPSAPMASAKKP